MWPSKYRYNHWNLFSIHILEIDDHYWFPLSYFIETTITNSYSMAMLRSESWNVKCKWISISFVFYKVVLESSVIPSQDHWLMVNNSCFNHLKKSVSGSFSFKSEFVRLIYRLIDIKLFYWNRFNDIYCKWGELVDISFGKPMQYADNSNMIGFNVVRDIADSNSTAATH